MCCSCSYTACDLFRTAFSLSMMPLGSIQPSVASFFLAEYYSTICLTIPLLTGILVGSSSGLLQIKLPWTFMCRSQCGETFPFLLAKCPEAWSLRCTVHVCLVFLKNYQLFCRMVILYSAPTTHAGMTQFLGILTSFWCHHYFVFCFFFFFFFF